MHNYSFDRNIRTKVTFFIVACSEIVSCLANKYFLPWILKINIKCIFIKDLFDGISRWDLIPNVFSISFWFCVLYFIYNRFIWKYLVFIHKIPNLNGEWEGKLCSSYKNKTEIDMKMIIKQTWDEISFESIYTNSRSNSINATIYVNAPEGIKIVFDYSNKSKEIETDSKISEGSNVLYLHDNTIEGNYYNNRSDRNNNTSGNIGRFVLTKSNK